jgi:hypothetical protein
MGRVPRFCNWSISVAERLSGSSTTRSKVDRVSSQGLAKYTAKDAIDATRGDGAGESDFDTMEQPASSTAVATETQKTAKTVRRDGMRAPKSGMHR